MRVRLKGVNKVRKKLADGTVKTFHYLGRGKGAVKLEGEPGSPEFMASYERAAKAKQERRPGTLLAILNAYQQSTDFTGLAERTRQDYVGKIRQIEVKFGSLPVAALEDRRTRGIMLAWRDELAKGSRRQADYTFVVLARVIAWGYNRGLVPANPLERIGKTYRGDRADSIWRPDDIAALWAVASPEIRLAFSMALHTGQRRGDLLRLPWSAYDGATIRLRQSKTGARVVVAVPDELRVILDATTKRSPIILTSSAGKPWTDQGFSSSWRKTLAKAEITGLTFNDLRGTAVTRMALSGWTAAEISRVTGHTLGQASAILDRHYVSREAILGNIDSPDFANRTANRPGKSDAGSAGK